MFRGFVAISGVIFIVALAAAGCGSSSPAHKAAASVGSLSVRTTLDGHTALPQRIHWIATPSETTNVSQVDFLIDGKLGWVEHVAPYYYGDDGNWLVTSFLAPGRHVFTVRVVGGTGKPIVDTVRASVGTPSQPPVGLPGTWMRTVTPADVNKATSGQPPPPGLWHLRITPKGWQLKDPTPGSTYGLFDVAYLPRTQFQMRPTIEYPPYPNSNKGGFCEDTDPLSNWSYSFASGGKTLVLHPVGRDPCGDRPAILEGTWVRVGG